MALSLPVVDNLLSFSKLRSLIEGQTSPQPAGNKPWRPPQWNGQAETVYVKTYITEQVKTEPANYEPPPGTGGFTYTDTSTDTGRKVIGPKNTSEKNYFFDAYLKIDHDSSLRVTEHPVQTGANISDHAYLLPATVVMEIGMSDAMDAYESGMFQGDASKSVSAYKTLQRLQEERAPLTLVTRLRKYENMIVENVHAPDEAKSYYGLRATVLFKQIIMATSPATKKNAAASESDRAQTAVSVTDKAAVQPQSILKQVPAASAPNNIADSALATINGTVSSVVSTARSAASTVTGYVNSVSATVKDYMSYLYPYGLPSNLQTMTYNFVKAKGYLPESPMSNVGEWKYTDTSTDTGRRVIP
jgi:hypothetical protein